MEKIIQQKFKDNNVLLAFLFGSQAKGYSHKESDVDIAVLLDEKVSPDQYFDKSIELVSLFKDLYPGKEKQISILNQATPLLKHEVLAGGKLLYAVNSDELAKFNLPAVRHYEDTKPIRELQYYYLKEKIKNNDF